MKPIEKKFNKDPLVIEGILSSRTTNSLSVYIREDRDIVFGTYLDVEIITKDLGKMKKKTLKVLCFQE